MQGVVALGYPVYFVSIIGGWKLLAGLAILAPRFPLLKEWAYAGIAFELTGATLSHVAMGSPAVKAIVPLVILAIAVASWALRPSSRKLKASVRHSPSPLSWRTNMPRSDHKHLDVILEESLIQSG